MPTLARTASLASTVALVIAALTWGGCLYQAERALRAEIRHATDAGHPMTEAELARRRDAVGRGDGPSAAGVYARAFDRYVDDEDLRRGVPLLGDADPPHRTEAWSEEIRDASGRFLEPNADAIRILLRAAHMGPAAFPVEISPMLSREDAHISAWHQTFRLLWLRCQWQIHTGRHDDAAKTLHTMWAMTEALRDHPALLAFGTRVSSISLASGTTEELLMHTSPSPEQLQRIQAAAEATRDGGGHLLLAFQGELAIGHIGFQKLSRGEAFGDIEFDFTIGWLATTLLQRNHAGYLQSLNQAVDVAERWSRGERDMTLPRAQLPGAALLAEVMLPSLSAPFVQSLRADARREVSIVGLALARYEREHGSWPDSLEALVPDYLDAVPDDPHDGAPLRYRRAQTGVVVYSIGSGRIDAGGRELSDDGIVGMGTGHTDDTFTLGTAQQELWPEQWTGTPEPAEEGSDPPPGG